MTPITVTPLLLLLLFRQCDSRNLNLSPFCGLDSSSTALKLQPMVEATYGGIGITTDYVRDLRSPLRDEYPLESMASDEILTSRVKARMLYDVLQDQLTKCCLGWLKVQRI